MNNIKEIAETVLNEENAPPAFQILARAYLELLSDNEATEKVYRMNRQYVDDAKSEITKLKDENESLKAQLENTKIEIERYRENIRGLEHEAFQYEIDLENTKEIILNHAMDIDSLRKSISYLRSENIRITDDLVETISVINKPLNKLSASIHKTNVEAGWWTDLATGEPLERNVGELLCLVHSEVSEALEAYRKSLMDDKLPHRKGFEVELADALIRIFDIAGKFKLDLDGALEEKMAYNAKRADHKLENRQGKNGKNF